MSQCVHTGLSAEVYLVGRAVMAIALFDSTGHSG